MTADEPVVPLEYAAVWLALAVLTTSTFLLSYVPMGIWQLPVALAIASVKAMLVVLFFMHLRHQSATNRLPLAAALLYLLLLLTFTISDVLTRVPTENPPGSRWSTLEH